MLRIESIENKMKNAQKALLKMEKIQMGKTMKKSKFVYILCEREKRETRNCNFAPQARIFITFNRIYHSNSYSVDDDIICFVCV